MPRERGVTTAAAAVAGSVGVVTSASGSRTSKRSRERGAMGSTASSAATIAPVFHPELRRTKEVIRRPEWVRHAGEAVAHRGSLGMWAVFGLLFSNCVGGGYGFEDGIGAAGPLITLVVCAVLPWLWCYPTGLAVAELSTAVPSNSGILMWTNAAFPPFVSFLCIIGTLFITFVGNAIYPNLTAEYVANVVSLNFAGAAGVKLGVLLLCCVLNIVGVEVVGSSSIVLCAVTSLPFVLVTVIQLFGHGFNKAVLYVDLGSVNWASFFSIISWNYANIENAGAVIEEIRNPRRAMPLAMMLLMLSTYMAYVLPMLAGVSAMGVGQDYSQWQAGHWPEVAEQLAGRWLKYMLFCGAILSGTGFTLTSMCCTSRLLAGMGTMQMFPRKVSRFIGYYHPRLGTPVTAVVLNTVLTMTFSVALDFAKVVSLCQCLYCLRMLLIYGAVIKLRIEYPRLARPFALPCNTLVAALCLLPAALFSLFAGIVSALTSRAISIALVCFVVGGAAVSYVYCRIFARNGFQGVIVQCEMTDEDAIDDDDVSAQSVNADEELGEGVFYNDGRNDAPGDMLLGILPLQYAHGDGDDEDDDDGRVGNAHDDAAAVVVPITAAAAAAAAAAATSSVMVGSDVEGDAATADSAMAVTGAAEAVTIVAAVDDGEDSDVNKPRHRHGHDSDAAHDVLPAMAGSVAGNGSYAFAGDVANASLHIATPTGRQGNVRRHPQHSSHHHRNQQQQHHPHHLLHHHHLLRPGHGRGGGGSSNTSSVLPRRYADEYSDAEGNGGGGGGVATTSSPHYRDAHDSLLVSREGSRSPATAAAAAYVGSRTRHHHHNYTNNNRSSSSSRRGRTQLRTSSSTATSAATTVTAAGALSGLRRRRVRARHVGVGVDVRRGKAAATVRTRTQRIRKAEGNNNNGGGGSTSSKSSGDSGSSGDDDEDGGSGGSVSSVDDVGSRDAAGDGSGSERSGSRSRDYSGGRQQSHYYNSSIYALPPQQQQQQQQQYYHHHAAYRHSRNVSHGSDDVSDDDVTQRPRRSEWPAAAFAAPVMPLATSANTATPYSMASSVYDSPALAPTTTMTAAATAAPMLMATPVAGGNNTGAAAAAAAALARTSTLTSMHVTPSQPRLPLYGRPATLAAADDDDTDKEGDAATAAFATSPPLLSATPHVFAPLDSLCVSNSNSNNNSNNMLPPPQLRHTAAGVGPPQALPPPPPLAVTTYMSSTEHAHNNNGGGGGGVYVWHNLPQHTNTATTAAPALMTTKPSAAATGAAATAAPSTSSSSSHAMSTAVTSTALSSSPSAAVTSSSTTTATAAAAASAALDVHGGGGGGNSSAAAYDATRHFSPSWGVGAATTAHAATAAATTAAATLPLFADTAAYRVVLPAQRASDDDVLAAADGADANMAHSF